MTRTIANANILKQLTDFLSKHSDLRFMQALDLLEITTDEDQFNEESSVTLSKMKKKIKELAPKKQTTL